MNRTFYEAGFASELDETLDPRHSERLADELAEQHVFVVEIGRI